LKLCEEGCPNWAQWRVSAPEKDGDGTVIRWNTVAFLCGTHKKAMQEAQSAADPKIDLRFNFVGSIPDGVNRPKS
jgi:hypothetical protein